MAAVVLGVSWAQWGRRANYHVSGALACCGVGCIAVQTLQVFAPLVDYGYPFTHVLEFASLLSLRVDIFQIQCFMGYHTAESSYAWSVFSPAAVVVVIILAQFVMYAIKGRGNLATWIARGCNAVGMVMLIFYLTLVRQAIVPWNCISHPNGKSTVSALPSVVCFEPGSHGVVLVLSCVSLLLGPLPFLAVCTYASWVYDRHVQTGRRDLIDKCRFLFSRWIVGRHYVGVMLVVKQLLIAMSPILVSSFGLAGVCQVFLLLGVLLSWVTFVSATGPWKISYVNCVDCATTLLLIVLAFAASALVGLGQGGGGQLQVILILCVSVMIAAVLYPAVLAAGKHFLRSKKYAMFLCHHKEGGGSLARWFKMLVHEQVDVRVFLDSDCLEDLENVFDIVKTETKALVILMTCHTLSRMWCAGEIVSAWMNQINVVPVACEDYVPVSDAFLDSLRSIWAPGQLHTLGESGISLEKIISVYRQLRKVRTIKFDRSTSPTLHRDAVDRTIRRALAQGNTAVERSSGRRRALAVFRPDSPLDIMVVCAPKDAEAVVVSCILQLLLQRRLEATVAVALHIEERERPVALSVCQYLLALLSPDVTHDPRFADMICLSLRQNKQCEVVTVVVSAQFSFPRADFFADVCKGHKFAGTGAANRARAEVLKEVFTILASQFHAQASWGKIEWEVAELALRFRSITSGRTQLVEKRSRRPLLRRLTTESVPASPARRRSRSRSSEAARSGNRSPSLPPSEV